MNQQDNNSIVIEDLAAPNADEIKGGPTAQSKRTVVLKSSVNEAQDDHDSLRGLTLNHNETVTADEADDNEASTNKLTDLAVSEAQSDEVIGGLLLPAVQKVREAAARTQGAGKVSYSDIS